MPVYPGALRIARHPTRVAILAVSSVGPAKIGHSRIIGISGSHPQCRTRRLLPRKRIWVFCAGRVFALRPIGDGVTKSVARLWRSTVLVFHVLLLIASLSSAQQDHESGHSIGKVSTKGDLILME